MTIEKIMQRLDRIEEALGITPSLTQNKTFLTLEEVREEGYYYHEYKKGVYKYKKDGKWTLIEKGGVLVDNADFVYWFDRGVYKYKKDGKITLVENEKVLIDNVDDVSWCELGVFKYIKAGKRTLVEHGEILVDGVGLGSLGKARGL